MNKLAEICAKKREYVQMQKKRISESDLIGKAHGMQPPRGFVEAIRRRLASNQPALIAEIKKASPSKGIIRLDFHAPTLAKAYEAGGATCLSVLTDWPYFQGADEYLQEARAAVSLPVLRKDFMVDHYQIVESRALGADCILLIMAALSDEQAIEFEAAAHALQMDVLVEVHDEEEFERAASRLTSPLIGINNRSLKSLKVDLSVSEKLAPLIGAGKIGVCESGIAMNADIKRMQAVGLNTFLVGESLMRQDNVTYATKQLLGQP